MRKTDYLQLRPGKNGGTWVYYRKIQGKPRRITIGKAAEISEREARRRADEISGNIARTGNPDGIPNRTGGCARCLTVGDAWRVYQAGHGGKVSRNTVQLYARAIEPRFGSVMLDELTRTEVRAWHAESAAEIPSGANRALALLSAVINAAIREDLFAGQNPASLIRKAPEFPRRRYLARDELERVLAVLSRRRTVRRSRLGAEAALLALLTGARIGEVLALRWDEIDFAAGRIVLPDRRIKTRTGRGISLGPAALDLLAAMRKRAEVGPASAFVFAPPGGKPIRSIKKLWAGVLAEAGVSDCHIHDLRHTYATYKLSAGVDLGIVSEELGHADVSTTKRIYAHVTGAAAAAAAAAAEGAIFGGMRAGKEKSPEG